MFKNRLFISFFLGAFFSASSLPVFAEDVATETSTPATTSAKWENLTPEEKEKARKNFALWKTMDPAKKQRMRERFRRFKNLTPQERAERIQRRENRREQRKNHPGRGLRHPFRHRR